MSLIRRVINGRRFCTAVARRAEDIMSNPDCHASSLEVRVWYLLGSRSDLDTAAKYARLAPFSRIKTEDTELTCQYIISAMLHYKRHKDVYDLYDYFFNQHKLKPNHHCCNSMIESRFQQGLVDEALDFHRSIKAGMGRDYPSKDTLRIFEDADSGSAPCAQNYSLSGSESCIRSHQTLELLTWKQERTWKNMSGCVITSDA